MSYIQFARFCVCNSPVVIGAGSTVPNLAAVQLQEPKTIRYHEHIIKSYKIHRNFEELLGRNKLSSASWQLSQVSHASAVVAAETG